MSIYSLAPIDLSGTQSYSLYERPSKVTVQDFAQPPTSTETISSWLTKLPNILAARDLRTIAKLVVAARDQQRAIIVGIGGHVIKCGLAPILIELMSQGLITGIAMNGSAAIHDFEIALAGFTSEDVDATLGQGNFGMAEETGTTINQAAKLAATTQIGFGEALGAQLLSLSPPHSSSSLLCQAYQHKIPVTIHLAIGTDIIHVHKTANGGDLGAASHHDFRLFCSLVTQLTGGGVYLNLGSAVIMPEVFLKAITVIRNLELPLTDFTTVNMDFIQHYRPLTNVVRRPVAGVGRGFSLTGHHEIMIPLLAAAILAQASE